MWSELLRLAESEVREEEKKGGEQLERLRSNQISLSFVSPETGSPITASCVGLGNTLAPPVGQAGNPVPGYNGRKVKLVFLSDLK